MTPFLNFVTTNRTKILVILLLLLFGFLLLWQQPRKPLQVAVAKGGRMQEMTTVLDLAANQAVLRDIVLEDPGFQSLLDQDNYGFLYAYPLGVAESKVWSEDGCAVETCAQVTFYDFDKGGTVEAVVNINQAQILDIWSVSDARPGASPFIIPRAMAAIAASAEMVDLLGDVRSVEPMMVPMSTWTLEGDCEDDWCVDMTYMSPDNSGRILHALVNMEKEEVSRVFYTRGRSDRVYKRPAAQGANYNNGCYEEFGWSVCWEMTAHDGIDFYDATYGNEPVFASAKISQIEVFYPSWPGGYRDEIGYASSVPPYYGTLIREFDDAFEISQIYTEFLRWPNCICCYRYEQKIRFNADGSFDPIFISHGPGCDDLSNYRPFWRIDLEFGDTQNDEVWRWENDRWILEDEEFSTPLFEAQSPEGGLLYFSNSGRAYEWLPIATDPSGDDDGRIFVLRANEGEGDGPVPTGPADTYWPPGQWLDGETLANQDIVIWYIPVLHTSKGEPWWCMPDPEPEFSPCDAVSIIRPAGELEQPSTEGIVSPGEETPASEAEETLQEVPLTPPPATPIPVQRSVIGDDPVTIIESSGCGNCHVIGMLGEPGKVGPDLSNIGEMAAQRVSGISAEEYIRQAIIEPDAFIAPVCPNGPCLGGIMPEFYVDSLNPDQLDILVTYLVNQRIEVHDKSEGAPTAPPPSIGQPPSGEQPPSPSGSEDDTLPQNVAAGEEAPSLGLVAGVTVIFVLLFSGLYLLVTRKARSE